MLWELGAAPSKCQALVAGPFRLVKSLASVAVERVAAAKLSATHGFFNKRALRALAQERATCFSVAPSMPSPAPMARPEQEQGPAQGLLAKIASQPEGAQEH